MSVVSDSGRVMTSTGSSGGSQGSTKLKSKMGMGCSECVFEHANAKFYPLKTRLFWTSQADKVW